MPGSCQVRPFFFAHGIPPWRISCSLLWRREVRHPVRLIGQGHAVCVDSSVACQMEEDASGQRPATCSVSHGFRCICDRGKNEQLLLADPGQSQVPTLVTFGPGELESVGQCCCCGRFLDPHRFLLAIQCPILVLVCQEPPDRSHGRRVRLHHPARHDFATSSDRWISALSAQPS